MNPKLTVIVPVYNAERFVKNCIESICNQTLKELEIIAVDDGSQDGSFQILQDLQAKDIRVKVLHQKNQGVSAARNAGLQIAKGEYVGFVDADDYVEPDYFQNFINAGNEDVISTIFKANSPLQENFTYHQKEIQGIIYPIMLSKDILNSACTKIFKNKIIQEHQLGFPFGMKLGEDAHFIMSFLQYAESFKYIKNSGYKYLENTESATRAVKNDDFFKRIFQEFEFDHKTAFRLQLSDEDIQQYKSIRLVNSFIANLSMYFRQSPYLSKKQRMGILKSYIQKLQGTNVLTNYKTLLLEQNSGFQKKILKALMNNNFQFLYWLYKYSHWRNNIR